MEQTKIQLNWGALILGIFFILISLIAFQNIEESLVPVVLCYGIFTIVKEGYEWFFRRKFKQLTGLKKYLLIVIGIIDISVGVFLFFNFDILIAVLPYVFALWSIGKSILGLFTLDSARSVSNSYLWFSLIIDILGIILGSILLFDPITSVLTLEFIISFYIMLFGIEEIIYVFSE